MTVTADPTAALVEALTAAGLTIAVAESLTGGLLTAELVRIPGASLCVNGGVVAYQTDLKHSLLGVDPELLAEHGPVHPEVAVQMARGVRTRFAIAGRDADLGVATTGVAGPDPQGGQIPGTVFLGLSRGSEAWAIPLHLAGDRAAIRDQTVARAIEAVHTLIAGSRPE